MGAGRLLLNGAVAAAAVVTGLVLSLSFQPPVRLTAAMEKYSERGTYVTISDGIHTLEVFTIQHGNPAHETVLLIGGIPFNTAVYADFAKDLVRRNLHVVQFDFPGEGLSSKPEGPSYSWLWQSHRIKNVIDQLGITGKVHLVAHDIGGPKAFLFALQHPEHVQSITIGSTIVNPRDWWIPLEMRLLSLKAIPALSPWMFRINFTPNQLVAQVMKMVFGHGVWRSCSVKDILNLQSAIGWDNGGNAAGAFLNTMQNFDLSGAWVDQLKAAMTEKDGRLFGVPLGIVWADATLDPLSNGQAQYEWAVANLKPEAHVMLEGAGHLSFADAPTITANAVAKMAAKHRAKQGGTAPSPLKDLPSDRGTGARIRA